MIPREWFFSCTLILNLFVDLELDLRSYLIAVPHQDLQGMLQLWDSVSTLSPKRSAVKGRLHLKWFSGEQQGPNVHWRSSYSESNSLQQDTVWVWGAGSVLMHYAQCFCKRSVIDQWDTDGSLVGINSLRVFACKQLRRKKSISVTLEMHYTKRQWYKT